MNTLKKILLATAFVAPATLVAFSAQAQTVAIADPDAAIASLARREPLLNKDLEKRRLAYALRTVMLTPEVAANGLGDVADARFARSFLQLKEAFDLPRVPTAAEVFDRRFLPPVAERRIAAK